jgi:hypothetical protein
VFWVENLHADQWSLKFLQNPWIMPGWCVCIRKSLTFLAFLFSVHHSPPAHSKVCSTDWILSLALTNIFDETSQENVFNHDKCGIHWSSEEAKVELIRIQSPDKTITAAEENCREDVCPWKIFEKDPMWLKQSHLTEGSEESYKIKSLGKMTRRKNSSK